MAKTQHLKHPSNFELPSHEEASLGKPIEELKGKDYSALSQSLLQKGEFRLLHGDKGGIEYFDMAVKLDPQNPQLFMEQGLALFEYGSTEENEEGLTLASKRFKVATTLDPYSFQAWHLWGNTLYFLGKRRNEPSYFTNALKKYEKAIELSEGQTPDVLADLYWDFGDIWSKLAEKSGEITDYHYAIKAYEKASSLQDDLAPEFWINFGNIYSIMGKKTNDTRLLIKAINCYKNAVSIKISFSEGWFLLAIAMKTLYSYTHDEDHFSQANECFSTTLQLSKNNSKAYLEWARLLLESGAIFKDTKKIRACIDKCFKAHRCDKKNSYVVAVWVEALALLGSYTEQLEIIHEALGKIEPLIEQDENTETFYAYGMCFYALGTYYKDIDYYYQALEQFQEGLSINRTHYRLWYAMASSSFAAALLDHDEKSYDRSLHFFEQALNLEKTSLCHSHYAMCLLKYGEICHEQQPIELSVYHFEEALNLQKNAAYLHTDWIFYYASALDQLAGFLENDSRYVKAIDLLNHILMFKPEFPHIHFQLALTYSHYAELVSEPDLFQRAIHHYRIAHQKEKENDQIILDWALTLVNLGDLLESDIESDQYLREAEYKMIQAAKLGNTHAYYALSCLYSVIGDLDNSLRFLEKAKAFDALPTIEEMFEDDWLENLRGSEGFQAFVAELESNIK
ncbi:MAG: hypothetical protein KFB93_04910 [Simkaniaceae bacterium]|nr:MAG: hypothetical protein KFB93_04910 [Simkaniaceae bacterium]